MGSSVSWRDVAGNQGVVELSYAEIFVGRAVECAVRTDDPMVSRRHARIYFQDGRHVIEDLGSANGVYVGDVRTQMHALSNGDAVRCGNLSLQYMSDGMIAAPAPMGGGGGYGTQMGGGMGMGAPPPASMFSGGGGGAQQGYAAPAYTPPSYGGGGGPGGGPPPVSGGFGGPPPASSAPSPPDYSPAEFQRMQRRIDQLASEVRLMRGGGHEAVRMQELEEKASRLERDNMQLVERNMQLQAKAGAGGGGRPLKLATQALVLSRVEEVVNGLNDVLSELRINILAAEGEVEQWAHTLPKATFELVRESLRSCRGQMEQAKELMRQLRDQR